jgi:hypothetical protein
MTVCHEMDLIFPISGGRNVILKIPVNATQDIAWGVRNRRVYLERKGISTHLTVAVSKGW